jgi:hypothetical protein
MKRSGFPTRFIDGKWIIDVQLLMSNDTLNAVKEFIIKSQQSRLKDLSPFSDKYNSCLKTIEAAMYGKIEQRLVDQYGGTKGDLVAFSAKKADEDRKIIIV